MRLYLQRMTLVCVALVVLASTAAGQARIQWERNVQQAVAAAQREYKPILFWVVGRADAERDLDDVYDAQQATFRDERVVALAGRFATIRISPDTHRDQLRDWGVSTRANLVLVVTGPDGALLDQISANALSVAESTARKLAITFRRYRDAFYREQLEATLTNEKASADELLKALEFVHAFMILSADQDVARLLERETRVEGNASPAARRAAAERESRVRSAVLETLGHLSTGHAAEVLVELAGNDAEAAKALKGCVPSVASVLLGHMNGDGTLETHAAAYEALCAVCRIDRVKPARFWENAPRSMREKEVARVREQAEAVSARWSEAYADYR